MRMCAVGMNCWRRNILRFVEICAVLYTHVCGAYEMALDHKNSYNNHSQNSTNVTFSLKRYNGPENVFII